MLYTVGSLVIGAISTAFSLWLKHRAELILREKHAALKKDYDILLNDYNTLVTSANSQIETLQKERDELLNALEKSKSPGVFADLLRKRNSGHQDPD